jgi:hypothetical protein
MPICSTVRSGETATGTEVTGEVCDASGGGGTDYRVEVMMTIDATHVDYVSCTPQADLHFEQTSKGHHQVWWKMTLTPNGHFPFSVKLKCKPGAVGATPVALAICTRDTEPENKHYFLATTHTMYHGHACNTAGAGPSRKKSKKRLKKKVQKKVHH